MDYTRLDPKAVKGWRITRAIGLFAALLICAGLRAGASFIPVLRDYTWIVSLALALFLLYKAAGLYVYPLVEYRQWGYCITEDKVDIRHGIYFITNAIIPIIRIQHITIEQGPVGRKLGLYKVELSLAGESFSIPCLTKETADEIAENLKAKLYARLERKGFEVCGRNAAAAHGREGRP